MQRIVTFLWFDTGAEEAAEFYTSLFPNSRVLDVTRLGPGSPSPGNLVSVSFEIDGQAFHAIDGGPQFPFTEAISLEVAADTQEEIDRLWTALAADGGEESQCGWLKDRFGLSWQIVPPVLKEWLADSDPEAAKRTMDAMLAMRKLDIAALQAAHAGG